jgi:hypothetical protein
MDIETVKLKLMDLISKADSSLVPRETHVFGNMHVPSYKLTASDFPIVTVHMKVSTDYMHGSKLPSVNYGEIGLYDFTCYVFATSIEDSRELADKIFDYLKMNGKHAEQKIIGIHGLNVQEGVLDYGAKRLRRTILTGTIWREENLL